MENNGFAIVEENGHSLNVWVGPFQVRIIRTDEGVVCEVYDEKDAYMENGPLASCYAYDNEVVCDV